MNFETVLKLVIENFDKYSIDYVLIGGIAVGCSGYGRFTKDIDILIPSDQGTKVKKLMLSFGYEQIFENEETLHFVSRLAELGRVDFLLAHRKYTLDMFVRAQKKELFDGKIKAKVATVEDIVGLKVQSSSNNPERYFRDMADIEMLLKINRKNLNVQLVEEYFDLFDRKHDLQALLKKIDHAFKTN